MRHNAENLSFAHDLWITYSYSHITEKSNDKDYKRRAGWRAL